MNMRDWAPHVRSRLSSLRLSPAREQEIVEELSQHLEDRWRELVAGGTPEDDATRLALAEFREGNLLAQYMAPLQQAQVPAAVTPGAPAGQGLRGVSQDVRYAMRTLRRQPAFSLTAILTLALGIGATTAMFSVVNGVVIKPLPYPESENVVTVGVSAVFGTERTPDFPLAPRMFASYAENGRSFREFGLFNTVEATVTGLGSPEHTNVLQVTRGVLTALGVQPVLGRWFSPDDDRPGAPETVMLSHGYWQRRFGGDPGIIGRAITIASRPREVIGVMPAGFSFRGASTELIVPFRFDPDQPPAGFCCLGVARLEPGATLAQANVDVARMLDVWKRQENRPQLNDLQLGPAVRPLKDDVVGEGVRRVLWALLGTIGIVLLIACANVANLLLVRAEGRRQELAVRTALGAGWRHVARLLMLESLTLGLLGGLMGLALAYGGLRVLLALAPENLPRLNEITIDTSVLVVDGGDIDRVGIPLRARPARADREAEIRAESRGVRPRRRTFGKRRQEPAPFSERARGGAGGVGPGAAHQLRLDDPHVSEHAERPARIHGPGDRPIHPRPRARAGRPGTRARHARAAGHSRPVGGDLRSDVRGVPRSGTDGAVPSERSCRRRGSELRAERNTADPNHQAHIAWSAAHVGHAVARGA